jgi:hypothetical protein
MTKTGLSLSLDWKLPGPKGGKFPVGHALLVHGLTGRTAVTNRTIPDPVIVPLEFSGNRMVVINDLIGYRNTCSRKFRMGAVVAGLAKDLVVHITGH